MPDETRELWLENGAAAYRAILGMCVRASELKGDRQQRFIEQLRNALRPLFEGLAEANAANFEGAAYEGDHPGYVRYLDTLVPFYLLSDLPAPAQWAELARDIQLQKEGGFICLSGSTILLGTLQHVGDIDYCEYVSAIDEDRQQTVFAELLTMMRRTSVPICEQVKAREEGWTVRSASATREQEDQLRALVARADGQLKLDFVTSTQAVGVVEATNVALFVKNAASLTKSFAAQEAPVGVEEGMPIPRELVDPLQLGAYIAFLIDQVDYYKDRSPVKALKRALSLTRILIMTDEGDDALGRLRGGAALQAALEARRALLVRLEAMGAPAARAGMADLLRELAMTIASMDAADAAQGPAPASADNATFLNQVVKDARRLIEPRRSVARA